MTCSYVEVTALESLERSGGDWIVNGRLRTPLVRVGNRVTVGHRPEEWAASIAAAMTELGYDAKSTGTARSPEIAARNCVFHHLAQQYPVVCRFDLAFLARASGRRVEHAECMLRGGHRCRFKFVPGTGIQPLD